MFRIITLSAMLLTAVPVVGDDVAPRFLDKQTYTLQLTNGTRLTGQVEHRDTDHIRVRTDDDFAITVPVPRIHEVARLDGRNRQVLHPLLQKDKRTRVKTIALGTKHKVTIRKNPTTQVRIRVVEWPEQTFLLWFPELVNNLWEQWDPDVARQDFEIADNGALVWSRTVKGRGSIRAILTPQDDSLLLETRVTAAPGHDIKLTAPEHCLHFSAAPDFACKEYSRIFVRVKHNWRSLLGLRTAPGAPTNQSSASVLYREGFLESGRANIWQGKVENRTMPDRADHPLMMCVSRSSDRVVATAAEDYQALFHNQGLPYLLCIHSAQAGVAIPREKTAVFRQMVWFVDGGIKAAIHAFDREVRSGTLKIKRTAIEP